MREQGPSHGKPYVATEEEWILFSWQSEATEGFLADLCSRKITLKNRLGVCLWEVGGGWKRKQKTGSQVESVAVRHLSTWGK